MSERVTLSVPVDVDAPAETVWTYVTDWERQGEWMLGPRVHVTGGDGRGAGTTLRAVTGIGPLGVPDTMEVVEFRQGGPWRAVVRHTGRVIRGEGFFEVVELGPERSRFTFTELIDLPLGALGRLGRCPWAGSAPEYVAYHDDEWGRPLHGVAPMFERLSLEGFQSGLSWLVILRKRPAFRAAFADFDPVAVAAFGAADVERLLGDAGIVRNRAKIEATLHNARRVAELDRPLDELLWAFAPAVHRRPATLADVPATTPESIAMAKDLKRRGLRFVGPTTCYALMQAAGIVDDHVEGCWRAAAD
ncbi:MAG: DNA-3-methyladenine glycosylase [Pseudonocardia sp.]|nr:DNA-3-methyladenine glycosylase [Pseudonocardia sp.]